MERDCNDCPVLPGAKFRPALDNPVYEIDKGNGCTRFIAYEDLFAVIKVFAFPKKFDNSVVF